MVDLPLLEIESCIQAKDFFISYFKHFHQYQALSFQVRLTICSLVHPRKTQLNLDVLSIQKMFEVTAQSPKLIF
jgi:hypothetical protein